MGTPYIVIEQKEDKKRRGTIAIVLAIAFVLILGVGGTYAYLTYTANQTPNRFTVDPNITADVLEPAWTNAAAETGHGTASDSTAIPAAADNMLPGSVVTKNPFVVNTSKNGSDEYAGLKVQFQKWNGTAYVNMSGTEVATLLSCYAFATDTTDEDTAAGFTNLGDGWTQIVDAAADGTYGVTTEGTANSTGAMYFYNTSKIAAETAAEVDAETTTGDTWSIPDTKKTTSLFTYVRFVDKATQTQINAMNAILSPTGSTIADPGWRVLISGAAIQATDDNSAAEFATDTSANWKTLLDANSTTDGSSTSSKPTVASGVRAAKTIPEATNL